MSRANEDNKQGYEMGLCHAYLILVDEIEETKNQTAKKTMELVATKLENRNLKLFKRDFTDSRGLHIPPDWPY